MPPLQDVVLFGNEKTSRFHLRHNAFVLKYNPVVTGGQGNMDLRDALIDWDEPEDESSNTTHIAEHGRTPEEVEYALFDENTTFDVSHSSGRPIAFGNTGTGRFIAIVFEVLNPADPLIIRPITAYDVPEPTE
jgi:uncharacterized DUF497 family protein